MIDLTRFAQRFVVFHIATNTELSIQAGYLKRGIEPQKGIAAPTLISLSAFQQEAMVAGSAQRTHCLDSGYAVGKQLTFHGNTANARLRSQSTNFFQARLQWRSVHRLALSLHGRGNKKAHP